MCSPLEAIKEWYKSLPQSHQIDIAAIAGFTCPGFERIDYLVEPEKMPALFLEVITECESNHHKNAGMAISLRAFIDFSIYRGRSKPAGWKENEEIMKGLAQDHASKTFEKIGNEMEFKAKQWISTCDKWNNLRNEHLNDIEIDDYIRSNAFPGQS